MKLKNNLKIAIGVSVQVGLLTGCVQKEKSQEEQPNLIIVYPDQMRGQAMGFLNEEPVQTPNLDTFSQQGLVLTEAASNFPVSSPSRASLMTGMYPQQHGVINNCNSRSHQYGYELRESDTTWSDVLKQKGYSLGYIGKWHLDNPYEPYVDCKNNEGDLKWNEWCPPSRRHSFDYWYAYGTYDFHLNPLYWTTDAPRDSFHIVDQWGPEHEADMAIKYLKNKDSKYRDPDKPFALVVSMNPPHTPYDQVPEKYKEIYESIPLDSLTKRPNIPAEGTKMGDFYRKHIRNYYAMITGVDDQFGRILKAINEEGLDKNTIVLFTSDHGNNLGIHHMESKNNYYDESMLIPFIIRWPDQIPIRKDDLLFSVPDIYPTLMGLMGFEESIPHRVNGVDYSNLFKTGEGNRPSSQFYMFFPQENTYKGRRGVRTARYTYVVSKKDAEKKVELYDNDSDPYQLNNIFNVANSQLIDSLDNELKRWLEKTGEGEW